MHGMLRSMVQGKTKKHLDIERIAAIKRATGTLLTLHGGSGTDDVDFVRAIDAGMNIIHVNTELRVAWRRSLDEALSAMPDEVVPYKLGHRLFEAAPEPKRFYEVKGSPHNSTYIVGGEEYLAALRRFINECKK